MGIIKYTNWNHGGHIGVEEDLVPVVGVVVWVVGCVVVWVVFW